ncbi:MAG: P-type conjugative transfer protein TrbG [Azoarcus sp.]|jgi:type IV secretion system protein VirB9|nr:P-type conjugative transfer protein TrbG [Azoarcus sp.]
MKKSMLSFALALAMPLVALANPAEDKYFANTPNPELTEGEKAALKIGNKFRAGRTVSVMKPLQGQFGAVTFVYGVAQPSIVCAVFQICDIALQSGEQILNVHAGDNERWTIEPGYSGTGATERQHVIIKPKDVDLTTNLIINTDRRTYYIRLRSHKTDYIAHIDFTYPDEQQAKWNARKEYETQRRAAWTTPRGEYLGDLKFDYAIDGNTRWTPVRVFSDGKKTIIEMPSDLSQTDAPALLVLRKKGGMFTREDAMLVNYRVQGNRYIVDSVPEQMILISGVGSGQERVTITKKAARG